MIKSPEPEKPINLNTNNNENCHSILKKRTSIQNSAKFKSVRFSTDSNHVQLIAKI